jgi:hypothetical protein
MMPLPSMTVVVLELSLVLIVLTCGAMRGCFLQPTSTILHWLYVCTWPGGRNRHLGRNVAALKLPWQDVKQSYEPDSTCMSSLRRPANVQRVCPYVL